MSQKNITVQSILDKLNIKSLNEMQLAAQKSIEKQKNTILLSATGSGKTLAFLLPLINMIDANKATSQAIIIVPSRELALQIEAVFKSMGTNIKVTCCYGGHKRETEENNLIEAPGLKHWFWTNSTNRWNWDLKMKCRISSML